MSCNVKMRRKKLNTRGSALLTVILVVSFLTILATTLLYISGMNFQIKQMDYQNKKNFYNGETALEEMKAEFMEDASEAAVKAYAEVSGQYVTHGSGLRELEYNRAFVKALQEVWKDKGLTDTSGWLSGSGDNWTGYLGGYYTDHTHVRLSMGAVDVDGNSIITNGELLDIDEDGGVIRVKNLKVIYTNDNNLTTIITTDLEVNAPKIGLNATDTAPTEGVADASKCVKYANWKKE